MRSTTLDAWKNKTIIRMARPRVKRKPSPSWKLQDSITYIKMRDKFLQTEGILVKIGEREYRLKPERIA